MSLGVLRILALNRRVVSIVPVVIVLGRVVLTGPLDPLIARASRVVLRLIVALVLVGPVGLIVIVVPRPVAVASLAVPVVLVLRLLATPMPVLIAVLTVALVLLVGMRQTPTTRARVRGSVRGVPSLLAVMVEELALGCHAPRLPLHVVTSGLAATVTVQPPLSELVPPNLHGGHVALAS